MTVRPNLAFSRRGFLGGAMVLAALPVQAQSGEPDVVVVGAGATGMAAAQVLRAEGKSVLVLEAANRIGGRAHSETETFGVPFDHGCSWLNDAPNNPLVPFARDQGFDLMDHSGADEAHYVGHRLANAAERRTRNRGWGSVERALQKAGEAGVDIAASEVVTKGDGNTGYAETWIGPMDWGVDFTDLSTADYWSAADAGQSFLVREGLGTVVARLGQGLDVRLNTPVTGVDWSGSGVRVETAQNAIGAKACIVTVSTGVLNAGAIRFTPELPVWKQEAISHVSMGLLVKIGLQFDGARLGFDPNRWLSYRVPDETPVEACYFLTWPFGFNYSVGFVGGSFGWEMSAAGAAATIDFALGEVVKMAGSDARKHFVKGTMSGWASNPLTQGAYAAARPGHFQARTLLARPVGDRVFFCGEATGGEHVALVNGAYQSGERAAQEVLAQGI